MTFAFSYRFLVAAMQGQKLAEHSQHTRRTFVAFIGKMSGASSCASFCRSRLIQARLGLFEPNPFRITILSPLSVRYPQACQQNLWIPVLKLSGVGLGQPNFSIWAILDGQQQTT
jgi:hypothetical protein